MIINKGKVEEKEGRREGGKERKEREGEIQNSKLIVVVVVVVVLTL